MLATSEKNLCWMGIDFRARWRRRAAVICAYLSFALTILLMEVANDQWPAHPLLEFSAMMVLTAILARVSVFGSHLVKSFDGLSGRMVGKRQMVGSLDEWAQYRYGVPGFEEATQEQQAELLRKYKIGNYLVPPRRGDDPTLDERERVERDRISRWALRQLAWYLGIYAGITAAAKHPSAPLTTAIYLWAFCILARTLPITHVLWTEQAPSDLADPQLVESEA